MTEPGPFQPVYLFLVAMIAGTIMIAGLYIAFTVLAPIIWL